MTGISVVSVDAIDIAAPIHQWEEAVSSCVGRMPKSMFEPEKNQCEILGAQPFSGRIEYGDLGDIRLCRMHTTANRFSRTQAPSTQQSASKLLVVSQQRGRSFFEHDGRHVTLQPGDWCILDMQYSFAWTSPAASEIIIIDPPRPTDVDLCETIAQSLAQRADGCRGTARVMNTMLLEAFNQMGHITVQGAYGVADAVTSLLWGALRDQLNPQKIPTVRNTQCNRLKAYIEAQLADPELCVESIAERCQMSTRSVHRAFAENIGGSVSDYIWHRRLAHCAMSLRDPQQTHRTITDIAISWGFGNLSHFSRAFRLSMGTSPRTYRALTEQ